MSSIRQILQAASACICTDGVHIVPSSLTPTHRPPQALLKQQKGKALTFEEVKRALLTTAKPVEASSPEMGNYLEPSAKVGAGESRSLCAFCFSLGSCAQLTVVCCCCAGMNTPPTYPMMHPTCTGLVQVHAALTNPSIVTPYQFNLKFVATNSETHALTITNRGKHTLVYKLLHMPAAAVNLQKAW